MLSTITDFADGRTNAVGLTEALLAHETDVRASAGRSERAQVARAEAALQADPSKCFRFDDDGRATLHVPDRTWHAGRFRAPSLAELRAATATIPRAANARLSVLFGPSPVTDIGALQGHADGDTLFQVASQFNCLEAMAPHVTPVASYFDDPTQGPRASISAFPGTLLRHYAAPGPANTRFVQTTDGPQLNLLAEICAPGIASVQNGYLRSKYIADRRRFIERLETGFDGIRVGVHDDIEVAFGYDWDGRVSPPGHRIAQVFTSTLAGGSYGYIDDDLTPACRHLLRAAYLGTLLAAAELGKHNVVLTLIGGGAFANPLELIWESILWAVETVDALAPAGLHVFVNARRDRPPEPVLAAVRRRGGAFVEWQGGRPIPG